MNTIPQATPISKTISENMVKMAITMSCSFFRTSGLLVFNISLKYTLQRVSTTNTLFKNGH